MSTPVTPTTTPSRPRRGPRRRALLAGLAALAVLAMLALVGLATTADGAETPDLAGRTFVSVETPGRTLVPGTQVRLTFGDDHLSARAGCNTLVGGATWASGVLEARDLASTMMACSPARHAQDAWLTALLGDRPAVALDGTTLTIGDATSGLVLVEAGA